MAILHSQNIKIKRGNMKEINEIGQYVKVKFHEETHTYIIDEGDTYNDFVSEYDNADESKKDLIKGKYKKNTLKSTTQHISDSFVFKFDSKLVRNWFAKTIRAGKVPEATEELLSYLNESIDVLNKASDIVTKEGSDTHHFIQEYIKARVNGEVFIDPGFENDFITKFMIEMEDSSSKLFELIDSIDELYDYEIPVGFRTINGEFEFAGMWDLLYKSKSGDVVLLDIKTGTSVSGEKKQKVNQQLNAYNLLVRAYYNDEVIPTQHICLDINTKISIDEDEEKSVTSDFKIHKLNIDSDKFIEMLRRFKSHQEIKKLR